MSMEAINLREIGGERCKLAMAVDRLWFAGTLGRMDIGIADVSEI